MRGGLFDLLLFFCIFLVVNSTVVRQEFKLER